MHPLLEDPWVAAQIDKAIEPHRHALTPDQIEAFREQMAWTFENHPAAQRVLERWRPRDSTAGRATAKASADEPPADKAGEDDK